MPDVETPQFEPAAERAAQAERDIQAPLDAKEQRSFQEKGQDGDQKEEKPAMQAGARPYPAPPFPEQHQVKPGIEAKLDPAPMYDAPFYKGSGKLEGKVALITGADSGIGRAVAVLFAREGADVAIAYLDEELDAAETRAAVEREGRRAILLPGDVADPAYAKAAVERTVAELGKLDVLVNNAAFQEHVNDFADLEDDHFDRTLKTNLYGYFYMAKAALPHLAAGSAIINTGSITGLEGAKQLLDYSATKGAIAAFTKALAQNLVPKGIRVNCVAPGPVWTPLNVVDKPAERAATHGSDTPMKRPAQPEEIAPTYVFLASTADSSYITGEVVTLLGGETTAG
jgi:NAD(P)-dependent dehydrogenase (short-subunit alcohol dehydrogenase family)